VDKGNFLPGSRGRLVWLGGYPCVVAEVKNIPFEVAEVLVERKYPLVVAEIGGVSPLW